LFPNAAFAVMLKLNTEGLRPSFLTHRDADEPIQIQVHPTGLAGLERTVYRITHHSWPS
jgi:hypothetical protein